MKSTQKQQSHLTDEEITVLLMSEAGWWKTRQAKKHILNCEACQERSIAFANVWQTAQIHAEKPVPTPKISRRWVLAGFGVAVITGIALLARPGTMGGPDISFAQVEKAMGEVRTVGWTEVVTHGNETRTKSNWISLVPEQIGSVTQVNYKGKITSEHTVEKDGSYFSVTGFRSRRHFMLMKNTSDFPNYNIKSNKMRFHTIISSLTSAPEILSSKENIETKTSTKMGVFTTKMTPWEKKDEVLETKNTIRFDRDIENTVKSEVFPKKHAWKHHVTIWIDPKTHRVIRRETSSRSQDYREILKDFQYNVTPPKSIFNVPKPNIGETYSFRGEFFTAIAKEQKQMEEALHDYHPQTRFASWRILSFEKGRAYTEGTFTQHTADTLYPPTEHTNWSLYAMVEIVTKAGKKNVDKVHFTFRKKNDTALSVQGDTINALWPPQHRNN
jgi:hypothetical protein